MHWKAILGPFWLQLVGDRGRWGIEEVFQAMEYLPYARSTHQRSPDEAVHEIQIDADQAGGSGPGGDKLEDGVPDRGRSSITVAKIGAPRPATTGSTGCYL